MTKTDKQAVVRAFSRQYTQGRKNEKIQLLAKSYKTGRCLGRKITDLMILRLGGFYRD